MDRMHRGEKVELRNGRATAGLQGRKRKCVKSAFCEEHCTGRVTEVQMHRNLETVDKCRGALATDHQQSSKEDDRG
jgi:hypothetical protein